MKGLIIFIVLVVIGIVVFAVTQNKKKPNTNFINVESSDVEVNRLLEEGEIITKEKMKILFDNSGLSKHWEIFEPKLREEINIHTLPEDKIALGQSKFGGKPDLPKNIEWFKEASGKSLSFIAQLNFSELQNYNVSKDLPKEGILYFFYSANQEAWGFDIKDKDKFKVFYSIDIENIESKSFPSDLEQFSIYKPCSLKFSNAVSLPSWENEFVGEVLNDSEMDSYMEITSADNNNKILGYSDNIQGEMELECQLVTNGLYCGDPSGYNDPRRKELEKGASDWKLLLQIDSEDDKTEMMWGDSGRLYFWIRQQDLRELNFEKSWFVLQCY